MYTWSICVIEVNSGDWRSRGSWSQYILRQLRYFNFNFLVQTGTTKNTWVWITKLDPAVENQPARYIQQRRMESWIGLVWLVKEKTYREQEVQGNWCSFPKIQCREYCAEVVKHSVEERRWMNEVVWRIDKWQFLCHIRIALFAGTTRNMHVIPKPDAKRCLQLYKATIPYLLLIGTIKLCRCCFFCL